MAKCENYVTAVVIPKNSNIAMYHE